VSVGVNIVQKEGLLALYKGLGAVVSGIVPKMAIRFSSFELFKDYLSDPDTGNISNSGIFMGN
jgi:solute carrier family 25 citrate transporter 1